MGRTAAGTRTRLEALTPVNAERIAIAQEPFHQINEQERLYLKNAAEESVHKLQRAGLIVSSVVQEGDPKEALVQEALDWKADAIFVGSPRPGPGGAFAVGQRFVRDRRSCTLHG